MLCTFLSIADRRSRASPSLRRPGGTEVLAHVERARHLAAVHFPSEHKRDGIAMFLAERAPDPDGIAIDRSGNVPRNELALMRAVDVIPPLPQMERVCRRAGGILELHGPP